MEWDAVIRPFRHVGYRPARRLRDLLWLTLISCLVGCGGGFEAVKPDPYVILTKRNELPNPPNVVSKYLVEPEPLPLPVATDPEIEKLEKETIPAPIVPYAARTIEPINVEPNQVTSTPNGQVVTAQGNYALAPVITGGRLNFSLANGSRHYCSAQFVGDTDVLLTAGHCVFDARFGGGSGTGWIADLEFVLGSGRQTPPPEVFDWQCIAFFKGWALDDPRFDYAFIKVNGRGPRALGLRNSVFPRLRATSFGYPSNISTSIISYVNAVPSLAFNNIMSHSANRFGPGSSGGAWVDSQYAESLNSFGRSNAPNVVFGPLLTDQTVRLFEYVQGGCENNALKSSVASESRLPLNPRILVARSGPLRTRGSSVAITAEPKSVNVRSDSVTCACDAAERLTLTNSTRFRQRVSLATLRRSGAQGVLRAVDTTLDLNPNEKRFIGCSVLGTSCSVQQILKITSATRLRSVESTPASAAKQTREVPVDIEMCVDRCKAGDAAWCQRLGARPSRALQPLRSIASSVAQPGDDKGIVLRRSELIRQFGGDPTKIQDPCARSEVIRNGPRVVNSGDECTIRSASLSDDPTKEFILALHLNPLLSARPAAPNHVQFDVRDEDPYIESEGEGSTEINEGYMGRVRDARIVGTDLVVATENGCLLSPDPDQP